MNRAAEKTLIVTRRTGSGVAVFVREGSDNPIQIKIAFFSDSDFSFPEFEAERYASSLARRHPGQCSVVLD